ncbi:MAG: sugar ABC transporter permease [Trueperaceae bacterium]
MARTLEPTLPDRATPLRGPVAAWRRLSPWKRGEYLTAALFLAPGLIWFLAFMLYPLLHSLWMSFHEWKPRGAAVFVGLDNFARVFQDPVNLIALRNTVVYAVLSIPPQMVLGLLVAIGLERATRGKVLFRLIYYLPVISSWVVVSLMFMFLFNSEGLFNHVFGDVLGWVDPNTAWLNRGSTALPVIAALGVWKGLGWSMLIYLAALQGIPKELVEAARIDGANGVQVTRYVTVPLLTPTTLFILVMLTIGSFQSFIQFYIMTGGGPVHQTEVFLSYMYHQAFDFLEFGYGSAIAWTLAALIMAISLAQFRLVKQSHQY